jgi:aminoglycoside phosphotransferase family enzyme
MASPPDRSIGGNRAVCLDEKVRFLSAPSAYSSDSCPVTIRETHMSWVFMANDRVYKLKKPVRFSYLDFSTLDRRAAACHAEYNLNRRLAPDVYLGVVPLTISATGLAIGGDGPVVDRLVVMRRLPDDATLEAALRGHWLTLPQVDRIAATLGAFYAHAPRLPLAPENYLVGWEKALHDNCRVLFNARLGLPYGRIAEVAQVQRRFAAQRPDLLTDRIRARHFVDAHGDLRPEHIWLRPPVTIIDCLEFDAKLRALDPLDEIAFLHLECQRLGGLWAADRIRRRLASVLVDDAASGLFLFYRSHRAMLRARLSIAHLLDAQPRTPEKWPRLARAYLRLAAADAARLERILGSRRRVPADRAGGFAT